MIRKNHIVKKGKEEMENSNELIESLKNTLIVSVQAYEGEPMRDPYVMGKIAEAAEIGGASAIRCQGLEDISTIKKSVSIPVIGLLKVGHDLSKVFITPTLSDVEKCFEAGADVVALDATDRPRPDGYSFEETVSAIQKEFGENALLMGDCATFKDIKRSFEAGCVLAGTTLAHSGTAVSQPATQGPNLEIIKKAKEAFPDKPIICEGSVHSPKDVRDALDAGAYAVVVGTAITHPTTLTSWFVEATK